MSAAQEQPVAAMHFVRNIYANGRVAFCPAEERGRGEMPRSSVNYKGWNGREIRNEWVRLTIVPKLGGRLMQVAFGPHEYLFVNKKYEGKYLPPLEPDATAKWYNYGGDKIWPLPEGRHDEQHWPGPVADMLDAGGAGE